MNKIEKLERRYIGPDTGCGGATFSDVIDKVNEIIDALNGKEDPELRESEDERIRKGILQSVKDFNCQWLLLNGVTKSDAIAWLEKQKEQKEKATSTLAKVLEDFAEKFRRLLKTKGIDYVPTNNFWNNIAIAYSKQEKLDFDKWYDDLMIPEEKQKEQKPSSTEDMPYITDEHFYEREPAKIRDDDKIIEYIRKDALLEWAKEKLENNVGQYDRDYDLALNSLIDKLNNF